LRLVAVDSNKVVTSLSEVERKSLNIINVPTIIVYDDNGDELNRYVEFAQESLEEDLLKILSREDYKHIYDF
jgi:thiol:disulfide interchange protein